MRIMQDCRSNNIVNTALIFIIILSFISGCGNGEASNTNVIQQAYVSEIIIEVAIPRADGTYQPAYVITSSDFTDNNTKHPLLVSLHSWSGKYTSRTLDLEQLALKKGWIYLSPDFRGPNINPTACGSLGAQQDVLDAVNWVKENFVIDNQRIYLTGISGGGHMALLMAGRYPEVWTAVSAWASITDFVAWHDSDTLGYSKDVEACTGGKPGVSPAIDAEYRARSPVTWLGAATTLPVDISSGIRDGHPGSDNTSGAVPIRHSIEAFNMIARSINGDAVSEEDIVTLSGSPTASLMGPRDSDKEIDAALGRKILLRRRAGAARITIFEGGHEGIATATIDFLGRFNKPAIK